MPELCRPKQGVYFSIIRKMENTELTIRDPLTDTNFYTQDELSGIVTHIPETDLNTQDES